MSRFRAFVIKQMGKGGLKLAEVAPGLRERGLRVKVPPHSFRGETNGRYR